MLHADPPAVPCCPGAGGIRKGTLILNLPGSPKAAKENLEAVLPAISHGLEMLSGRPADCAKLTD